MKGYFLNTTIICLLSIYPIAGNAQIGAKITGLKDKVIGGGKTDEAEGKSTLSKSGTKETREQRLVREDLESTILDNKEIKQDSKGVSGIYYLTSPILASNSLQNDVKIIGKVLLEYNENPDDRGKNNLKMSNRYSFEANDRAKFVEPAYYSSQTAPASLRIDINNKAGHVHFTNMNYIPYKTVDATYSRNLQNEWVFEKETFSGMPSEIIQLEPGIFAIYRSPSSHMPKELQYKHNTNVILYKKELEEKAQTYTGEAGHKKIAEIYALEKKVGDELESGSSTLMTPKTGFKSEPTRAVLEAAMKKRMAKEGWKEELIYAYPGSEWVAQYEHLGLLAQRTLMRRVLTGQAVFKINGKYKAMQVQFQQDNNYTTGSLEENYSGKEIYVLGIADLELIDEKKALQYKK